MSVAPLQAQQLCGGVDYPFPYTDVSSVGAAFCPGIMQAYVTGVSKGTTPTTFSPVETVTRVQMTTFLQRSLDQGLTRASLRAALNQWWVPQNTNAMQTIFTGSTSNFCAADGDDIWIAAAQVVQVQANNGKLLGIWPGATDGSGVQVAAGKIFVTGYTKPGSLYVLDPTQSPGSVTVALNNLPEYPSGIAFDGTNLWTANDNSVSIISPQPPYTTTTVSTGFSVPVGVVYDGTNMWVRDLNNGLLKVDAAGAILQTIPLGFNGGNPVFDGTNIWVPNQYSNTITVVQAATGNVVATITSDTSNQLNDPTSASFDGERVLVTNSMGNSVTVFKAADLSFIANVSTGAGSNPFGTCSDGINFWILLGGGNTLRF